MFIAKNEDVIVLANEREDILKELLDRSFMTYTTIEETDINYILYNGQYVTQEEIAEQERQRIAMLSLTRGDVFRGLLLARNVTRQQLRTMIETNPQLTDMQKEMALIDFDEALNFYRGNTLIDTVGLALGIEPSQLDCFFETNDYTCLYPKVEPPVEEETNENESNTEPTDIPVQASVEDGI